MPKLDSQRVWQAALGELELQMTRAMFDTWLRDTRCIALEDEHCLVIGVKNGYAVEWLENRLYAVIQRVLHHLGGQEIEARFVVWEGKLPVNGPPTPLLQGELELPAPDPGLNSSYTFGNYVVGSGNRLAQAASMAVSESPARAYNPLFLYGGVGLGKTHLLHAIGQTCHARNMRVLYLSSEQFTNDLVEAIRTHTTDSFRDKYRGAEVLLVDDIQFIAGKESTQEEFFHTFNALRDTGHQIVLSSDRPPKAMVTLEERLRSRFEWGLIVDIQPPDFETRLAILQNKAAHLQVQVPDDVLTFIAGNVESNIRELEGALNQVLAVTRLTHQPFTVETAKSALGDLMPSRRELSADNILKTVADFYNISLEDLRSERRNQRIAFPRQVAMFFLREETGASLPQIGARLGGRDHTTIMYGCERIRARMEQDSQTRRELLALKAKLYEKN